MVRESRVVGERVAGDGVGCQEESGLPDIRSGLQIHIDRKNYDKNAIFSAGQERPDSTGLWQLASDELKVAKTRIRSGDFVRFGSQLIQARIKPAKTDYSSFVAAIHQDVFQQPPASSKASYPTRSSNSFECRFCLEGSRPGAPLLFDICACSASMPVHYPCLAKWLKCIVKPQKCRDLIFFDLSCINCDVCKQRYPMTVRSGSEEHYLLDLTQAFTTFFVSFLIFDYKTSRVKGLVLVDLSCSKKHRITVGKSEKNVLRFLNPTVKEDHAYFQWKNEALFLVNQDFEFGSFRKVTGGFPIDQCDEQVFWVDGLFFTVHLNHFLKKCCCDKRRLPINPLLPESLDVTVDAGQQEGKEGTLFLGAGPKGKKAGTLPPLDLRGCHELKPRNASPKCSMPMSERLPKTASTSLLQGPSGPGRRANNLPGLPLRLRDLHDTTALPAQSHRPSQAPFQQLFPSMKPTLKMVLSQRGYPAPSQGPSSHSFLRQNDPEVSGQTPDADYRFN